MQKLPHMEFPWYKFQLSWERVLPVMFRLGGSVYWPWENTLKLQSQAGTSRKYKAKPTVWRLLLSGSTVSAGMDVESQHLALFNTRGS